MYNIENVEKIEKLISKELLTKPIILREEEIREDIP